MRSGLKMLLAGIIFGFMAVFAFIGVKSLVNDPQKNQVQVQPPDIETSTILGQPTPAAGNRTGTASPSLADQGAIDAADQGSVQPTLVGEPDEPADGQPADPAIQAEPATDTNIASPESPASETGRVADADTGQVAAGAATDGTADTDTTAATPADTATDTAPAQPDRSGSGGAELIDEYGALELSLTDPADPQRKPGATFIIRDVLDLEVASMENTDSATFDLPPGIYEVTVVAEGKKNARMVEITANQVARERFELPNPPAPASSVQTGQVDRVDSTPTPDGADATPAPQLPDTPPPAAAVDADTGRVQVFVRAGGSNAALKANIYIQQPNGVHVAKGSYADNVEFTLQPGRYRITAKTKGKQDVVRDINLVAGQVQQQIIVMESLAAQTPNRPAPPPEGTLNLVLRSPPGAAEGRGRFVVTDSEGQRVARVGGVANAQIKLEPGSYDVMAVYRQRRITKRVTIAQGQARSLDFQVSEFEGLPPQTPARQPAVQPAQPVPQPPPPGGVLQLIAVNGVDQQPLPVSFSVVTLNGQLLRSFDGVAFAELSLAPQEVLVNIDYRGMHGQERIRVTPGDPTVFTFTITPNNMANPVGQQPQPPQSLEGLLMDRLQQELQRQMR